MKKAKRWIMRFGCLMVAVGVLLGQEAFGQDAAATARAKAGTKVDIDRKIEAMDMILVNVFGEAEFKGDGGGLNVKVTSSGAVSLYLLGVVQVAGKTPAEAEVHIRNLLKKDFIRDPHVLVQVRTYRVTNVTIMGQVKSPGLVALPDEQKYDLLAGIAKAGGFTRLARTSKIELTRSGVTRTFDLDELKKETDPNKKIWLQRDDMIFVRESAF